MKFLELKDGIILNWLLLMKSSHSFTWASRSGNIHVNELTQPQGHSWIVNDTKTQTVWLGKRIWLYKTNEIMDDCN
jgi:hypothetical protein